ncbi:MAG: UbiD family decarboxylase [Chloroflexi bacterium]|nr:UbiD family decarboxylase [Chloroflexota bacterium]
MADDLRGFIAEIDEIGELVKIDGADWNLDLGALATLNGARPDGPAILFDNIKGYPPGYRVLTASTATPNRVAHVFGLPLNSSKMELVGLLRKRLPGWGKETGKFAPVEVEQAPILENVQSGDQVDVFKFPTPMWHELDGGRYIGTGDSVITMDPDTGEINLGTYRVMISDKNTVTVYARRGTHGRIHYEKWHAQGKPCPVAVSVGQHPLIQRISNTSVPDEYSFIGAIRQKPVQVIREEVTGLPIPADAEIVLAGFIPPGEMRSEGPFGEWLGYYAAEVAPAPALKVERIYHRNDPIILGTPNSRPPDENTLPRVLVASAVMHNWLDESGIPDVKGVYISEAGVRLMITVSVKQRYDGHAKQAAMLVAGSRHGDSGANMTRFVVVVDDDIDPSNVQEVLWAMCTRCDPVNDIDIIRRTWSSGLDPMIRRPATAFYNSRAIIDACKPFEWKDEFPKEITISPELEAKVRAMWGGLIGLK